MRKKAFPRTREALIYEGSVDVAEVEPGEFWFASNRKLVRFDGSEMRVSSHFD